MTEVSKHRRTTASGKTTTVRQHHRNTGGAGDAARSAWARRVESSSSPSSVPHVSSLEPAEPDAAEEGWWDDAGPEMEPERPDSPAFDRMAQEMRDWRALGEPEPSPEPPHDPGKARLLGTDTPEGRAKYDRLRAYREAGYAGPLDQDGNIPDPDDPENWRWMDVGADMQERRGGDERPGEGADAPNVISRAEKRGRRRNATPEDKEAFRRADEALQENSYRERKAGIRHETDEYLRLNDEVWRLGRRIGKW